MSKGNAREDWPIDEGSYRTLLVMRHAKSSWSKLGLADYDRPL